MKDDEPHDSPRGLWRFGCEFVTIGHDALACHRKRKKDGHGPNHSHVPPSKHVPFPIYYNFLHGIELGLKAYLRHVDAVPLKDLRNPKKFGHHLDRLFTKALCHSLREECPELTDIHVVTIRYSSKLYAEKEFEYIRIGGVQLMAIDQVVEAADILIAGLGVRVFRPTFLNQLAGKLPWLRKAIDLTHH